MQKIEKIRGLQTAWLEESSDSIKPDAPIYFFIHGVPDTPECWRAQLDHFKQHGIAVAPYLRGIEPSLPTRRKSRYSPDGVALDHLEILNRVDPKGHRRVVVIGHDLGGPHAWHLASLLGVRLSHLVVINAPSITLLWRRILASTKQMRKSWYVAFFQLPWISNWYTKTNSANLVRQVYRAGGIQNPGYDSPGIEPFLEHYRQGIRDLPRALKKGEKISAPTLVLWGEKDAFLEVPTVAELREVAVSPVIRILPGNHWIQHEMPEKVNHLISDFVGIPQAGTGLKQAKLKSVPKVDPLKTKEGSTHS